MHLIKIKKWIPPWVILTTLVFSIGTVWIRLRIVRMTYEIHQIENKIDQNKQILEKLEITLSELKSPKHLEYLARTKYHLKPPQVEQVISIGKPKKNVHHP